MALMPPSRLADDAVVLRPPAPHDVAAITAACQDPEIGRWTRVPSPYGEPHARAWIDDQPEEDAVSLLAVRPETGELVGAVGLIGVDPEQARAEIGFWTAPRARGHGVAGRSIRLLAGWGFEALALARLQALTHRENRASQRTLERAGFVREGLLRSYEEIKGERWDMAIYSLLAADLAPATLAARHVRTRAP